MTQEHFDLTINNFDDLIEFGADEDCDITSGIIDISDLDEYVCEDIREAIQHEYWHDVRDRLNALYDEVFGEYFIHHDTWNYTFIGEDEFDDYKEQVRRWAVENDIFEEEPEEEGFEIYPWESELVSFNSPIELEEEPDPDFELPDLNILFMPA